MGRYEQLAGAGAPDRVEQYRKTLRQVINIIVIVVTIMIILILKSSPMLKNLHKLCDCRLSMCGSTSSPRTLLSRQTSPVFLTLRVSAGRLVGMVTMLLMSVLVFSGIFRGEKDFKGGRENMRRN